MALPPGSRIGSYTITGALGAGGMGEVYRARDEKLQRDVALKVLPDSFAGDAERLARFRREAQTLAALNHPHIAHVHGLEEGPGGVLALVMELVEGDDLSARLTHGALPFEEAVPIARHIVDALAAAHEAGIVHRDLKPANIKVRVDGTAKVLDFGLAKALDGPAGEGGEGGEGGHTHSPTITTPPHLRQGYGGQATGLGVILGTAAYMAPEQAKGYAVDRRADIWAFGAVLFEMLSGRRAFAGDDVGETLASVIKGTVEWAALPATTPPRIRRLIEGCLTRDKHARIADIAVARFVLADAEMEAATPASKPQRWKPIVTGALAGALATGAISVLVERRPSTPPPVTRLSLVIPGTQRARANVFGRVAISPDGSELVYVANDRLFRRRLAESEATPVLGTEVPAITGPVYSPDGSALAFHGSASRLLRVPVAGGTALEIARLAPATTTLSRPSWADGYLLVTQPEGILRIPENGGPPELLVRLEPTESAASPQMLPGGDVVMFTIARGSPRPDWLSAAIVAQSLSTGQRTVLVNAGSDGQYVPTGHLVFMSAGVLFAAGFDLPALRLTTAPIPVVEGVRRAVSSGLARAEAHFAVSRSGTLVYAPGPESFAASRTLSYLDRQGNDSPLPLPAGHYENPRISPDGTSLAFGTDDGRDAVVWIYDLAGGSAPRRLTFAGKNRYPTWSPDGREVAFQSERDSGSGLYVQRVDGAGEARRLTESLTGVLHIPESWSPDGRRLSFSVLDGSGASLWSYSFADAHAEPFGNVRGNGPLNSAFSRDGRWLAYTSRSAPSGVFVQPVPPTGARFQVSTSTETGHHPFWSPDGKELFYFGWDGGTYLVGVPMAFENGVKVGSARLMPGKLLSNTTSSGPLNYAIAPDGRRFIATRSSGDDVMGEPEPVMHVIVNWFEELKQRVPIR